MSTQLSLIVNTSNLEPQEGELIISKFNQYEAMANEWKEKAKHIKVTDESQVADMEMANVGRKFLAEKRIDIERTRKSLKEQSLRKGQAIDAIAKFLTSLIEPTEKYLKEQADFIKIKREREEAERVRLAAEAEAKRIEDERIAKEKKDAEEKAKLQEENARLLKEMAEKQKALAEKQKALNEQRRAEEVRRNQENAEKAKLEAELRAKANAEIQRVQAENEAKRKLQMGNDKEKMSEFKRQLSQVPTPVFESQEYKTELTKFINWINSNV